MVSAKEIVALRKTPSTIAKLNKPGAESYSTYYIGTINYFLCGTPTPDIKDHPIAASLFGIEQIKTPSLDAGHFMLVPPDQISGIAKALEQVDLKKLRKQVETADAAAMVKSKVGDFELLKGNDAPAAMIVSDVRTLTTFYKDAASRNVGVVLYTS
ncbi:MAG: DUF1877 family protein [Deltaproteobacteria bacterium]|nr:DUF1877 family protein [Deltaproteobacteria bacterium]MCW5808480.1 DUF1877 family protein [Deltaproteobacteria bacterium]